jgi:hypothetical protein
MSPSGLRETPPFPVRAGLSSQRTDCGYALAHAGVTQSFAPTNGKVIPRGPGLGIEWDEAAARNVVVEDKPIPFDFSQDLRRSPGL